LTINDLENALCPPFQTQTKLVAMTRVYLWPALCKVDTLEARRTIAYGYNTLCGEQQLLKDFFVAGVRTAIMQRTSSLVSVALTNMTGIPYTIRMEGGNPMKLDPFTTLWLKVPAGGGHM
jgi:hypothetical protein